MTGEYDLAFSLGFSCAGTQALRYAGLQSVSYPLDWTGSPGLLESVAMIERDFADWFERGDLVLWDVRIEYGHVSRVYKNVRTGFGFTHEFTNVRPIESAYDEVRAKYDRRISRFRHDLAAAKRVLAVYIADPRRPCPEEGVLAEARRRLEAKYPNAAFDLVCADEDPSARAPVERTEGTGLTFVGLDYRTMLDGQVMHVCNFGLLKDYLQERIAIVGRDAAEERRKLAVRQRRELASAFGKSRLERWINRRLCGGFHDVCRYLIRQRLVPGDRPLWFDGDGK